MSRLSILVPGAADDEGLCEEEGTGGGTSDAVDAKLAYLAELGIDEERSRDLLLPPLLLLEEEEELRNEESLLPRPDFSLTERVSSTEGMGRGAATGGGGRAANARKAQSREE